MPGKAKQQKEEGRVGLRVSRGKKNGKIDYPLDRFSKQRAVGSKENLMIR